MSRSRLALAVALLLFALSMCFTSLAGAYATIAPPPKPSPATGLPDGRVYEEVSPANKHGFEAGALAPTAEKPNDVLVRPSVAAADGNAVTYGSTGPAAETVVSGMSQAFVAERTQAGWRSRSTMARGIDQTSGLTLFFQLPALLDYSPDLSHLAYEVLGPDVQGAPAQSLANAYLMGSDPFGSPAWLLQKALEGGVGGVGHSIQLLGMSPDAGVVYLAVGSKLLEQDSARSGWGIYEYRNGKLSEAGLLPDGSVPPTGALPAAAARLLEFNDFLDINNPASLDNEVSEDGRRLVFVAGGELYVHEIQPDGSERSVLASASHVEGHVGEAAPHGVLLFKNLTQKFENGGQAPSGPTYAYASPDGSHVFFQSDDQLTASAPSGSEAKVYSFDVDTGSLEYLPGVSLGGIVTAASDGSSFIFVNNAATPELERWTAGLGGGAVSAVAQLPGMKYVGPGRLAANDSVLVFQTDASIAGFNNAGTEQIYRYDAQADELSCLSCPPVGVKPSGNAYLSAIDQYGNKFGLSIIPENSSINDVRGVSSDGKRVFFGSPDPLVGRDTNGQTDVYEWESGNVFLISSGTSGVYSVALDNGASGADVFFATIDELVPGDNDNGFDVYDARVPHPGDSPPPAAVSCVGDVCQGPPSVAELLGPPASAAFNGTGNIAGQPASPAKSTQKGLTRRQRLMHELRVCHKRKSKRKRSVCERRARRRYRAAAATARRNNGRGK